MKEHETPQNVFWTGGLDSTFRVLYLLHNTNKTVQPHYIVRHEDSTGNEIDAMIKIQKSDPVSFLRFTPMKIGFQPLKR